MSSTTKPKAVKHTLFVKFKDDVTREQIEKIINDFTHLVNQVEPLKSLHWYLTPTTLFYHLSSLHSTDSPLLHAQYYFFFLLPFYYVNLYLPLSLWKNNLHIKHNLLMTISIMRSLKPFSRVIKLKRIKL
jgi:hypothetical protein